MLTYHYPMVYIGNVFYLKSYLRFSDRISCSVYDREGSLVNNYKNGSIYNLVIKQDIVDGELQVDLAIHETVETAPRFTLSYGTYRHTKKSKDFYDVPKQAPNKPYKIAMLNSEEPFLPGVAAPFSNFYEAMTTVPAVIFDNLEYCKLLILVTGCYVVIIQGWNMPDDASKEKISNLYESMALLTGY